MGVWGRSARQTSCAPILPYLLTSILLLRALIGRRGLLDRLRRLLHRLVLFVALKLVRAAALLGLEALFTLLGVYGHVPVRVELLQALCILDVDRSVKQDSLFQ